MTVDSDSNSDETTLTGDSTVVGGEEMIAAAKTHGADWAVFGAVVEAVSFPSADKGNVILCPITIADESVGGKGAVWLSGAQELPVASFDASDEALYALMTNMGNVLVGVHAEEHDGETVWVIHEAYAEDVPVE